MGLWASAALPFLTLVSLVLRSSQSHGRSYSFDPEPASNIDSRQGDSFSQSVEEDRSISLASSSPSPRYSFRVGRRSSSLQHSVRFSSKPDRPHRRPRSMPQDIAALHRHRCSHISAGSDRDSRSVECILSSSEERHRQGARLHQPHNHQPLPQVPPFQDGGHSHSSTASEEEGLSHQVGHGRLLHALHSLPGRPQVPPFHVRRNQVRIRSHAFRPRTGSSVSNQVFATCNQVPPPPRCKMHILHRRCGGISTEFPTVGRTHTVDNRCPSFSGLQHSSRESVSCASTVTGDPGHAGEFSQDGIPSAETQDSRSQQAGSSNSSRQPCWQVESPPVRKSHRQVQFSQGCSTFSTSAHLATSSPPEVSSGKKSVMGRQADFVIQSPRRARMVVPRAQAVEWQVDSPPQDLSHSDNRCKSLGLGRSLEADRPASSSSRRSSRLLLGKRKQEFFELEGVVRSLTYPSVSSPVISWQSDTGRDRQQHDQSIHQSHGRQIESTVSYSSQALVTGPEVRLPGSGRPSPRSRQPASRSTLQVEERQLGLQTSSSHLSSSGQAMGPPHHRSLRQSTQQSDSSLCSMEARSAGSIPRRSHSAPAERECLVLSSRGHHQQSAIQDHSRASHNYSGGSSLAIQGMVANPVSSSSFSTHPAQSRSRDSASSRPEHIFRLPTPSSRYLEDIRCALEDCSVSEKRIEWTLKGCPHYAHATWSRWKSWCLSADLSPLTCASFDSFSMESAVRQLADFLAHVASDIANYGTLCNHRACVNTFIQTVFNCCSLSEQPAVQEVMKGVNKVHPSQPRWSLEETYWDPGLIVEYYTKLPDNHSLTTADLARKSFVLFAIASWPRCSDAARTVRSSIQFTSDGTMSFRYFGTKELRLPVLGPKCGISSAILEKVCPVRCVKAYLDRSAAFDHGDRVWCSTRPLHGQYLPTSEKGDTLRRWMRDAMTAVGIDPRWTGGSIRMAASSKALDDGIEPAYIMKLGRWKSFAMWNQFYNRALCRFAYGPTFSV